MDHQEALSMQAVERYTLGELISPQREDFEEHFAIAQTCKENCTRPDSQIQQNYIHR